MVKLLLQNERVNSEYMDMSDRTPLSWAAGEGHEAVVKVLLADHRVGGDNEDIGNCQPLI